MSQPASILLLVGVLLVAGVGQAGEPARADDAGKLYQRLLQSSLWVATPLDNTGDDARRQWSTGTAAIIDRDRRLALTSWHIVRDHERVLVCFPAQQGGALVSERRHYDNLIRQGGGVRGRIVARDRKHDLALIQVDSLPDGAVALAPARDGIKPGERVHTIGNPGDRDWLWVCSSRTVREVGRFKIQSQAHDGKFPVEARLILTDGAGKPGESGGPLLNDRGELVGVTQGYREDTRQGCHIDLSEVRAFLQSDGVLKVPVPPPIAGPKPEGPPADREQAADRRLRFARLLLDSGKNERAREVLQEIVETCVGTPAAEKARQLLDGPR